jgi:peptide deformylase
MAIRPILRAGHPILARVADEVPDPTADMVAHLVGDMIDTLDDSGANGIAAPQIGVPLRVVIYFMPQSRCTARPGDDPVDLTVLVNPRIEPVGDARYEDWDGCLSFPGLRGRTTRWERIRLVAWDLDGLRSERIVAGSHARVVQHECDHLDGVLYPTLLSDPASLGFLEELTGAGRMPARVPARAKSHLAGRAALLDRLRRAGISLG